LISFLLACCLVSLLGNGESKERHAERSRGVSHAAVTKRTHRLN